MNTITFSEKALVQIVSAKGEFVFDRLNTTLIPNATVTKISLAEAGESPVLFSTVFETFTITKDESTLILPENLDVSELTIDQTYGMIKANTQAIFNIAYKLKEAYTGDLNLTVTFEGIASENVPAEDLEFTPVNITPVDKDGTIPPEELYSGYNFSQTGAKVLISCTALKSHTNAEEQVGHWISVGFQMPEDAETVKYALDEGTFSEPISISELTPENQLVLYFDASVSKTRKVTLVADDGQVDTFTIDMTGVDLFEAEPEKAEEVVFAPEVTGELVAETATFSTVTLEEAIRNYEEKLDGISEEDIQTIKSEYATLDKLRQTVLTAINGLDESAEKNAFLVRYKAAATNQFTAYKLLLSYEAKDSYLNVISVKNVGGNRPYLFETLEHTSLMTVSKAVLFSPVTAENDITNYPNDFMSHLTDPTKISFSGTMPQGESVLFVEIDGKVKKLYLTVNESGALTKFNDTEVSLPENGNVYNTPQHQAMLNIKEQTTLTAVAAKSVYDKSETVQIDIDANFPSVENTPVNYVRAFVLKSALLKTNTSIKVTKGEDEEVKTITLEKDETSVLITTPVNLSATLGAEKYTVQISGITYVGEADTTIEILAGEEEYLGKQYTIGSKIAEVDIIDRQAALDHAIANTSVEWSGDVIQTEEETIDIKFTTTYPEFLPALDPELKIDTLLTLTQALPVGTTVELKSKELSLGTYEVSEPTTKLWFTEIIGESSNRGPLTDKSDTVTEYNITFTNLDSNKYGVKVQVITAKDGMFDSSDARHTLAFTDINMEVTDKTEINSLIISAETLLGKVQPGEEPGQAPQVAIEAFTAAIAKAKGVKNDGDATISDIATAITELTEAINEFKTFIVKIKIDKSVLLQKITDAKALISDTQVGSGIGQIPTQGHIDTLQSAVTIAQGVYDSTPNEIDPTVDEDTTQQQVNSAADALNETIIVFTEAIITDAEFVETNLTSYEASALAFLEGIRKKINI